MQTKEKSKFTINFRPLLIAFLSLLAGICLARSLYMGSWAAIVITISIFLILIISSVCRKKFYALLIAALFFFGGNGVYFLSYNTFMGKEYQNVYISGRVCSVDGNFLTLEKVTANTNRVGGVSLRVQGEASSEFQVGDFVMYEGSLEHIKMFTLGSFNSFSYRREVAYNSTVNAEDLNLVSGSKTFDEKAREQIKNVLYKNMSSESADLAYAVLTGEKSEIDDEVLTEFSGAGIVHLLTVSGLHISFLIAVISFVLKKLKVNKFINFILIFCISLIYTAICGFAPSVVRAMIMGIVLSLAGLFSKQYDLLNSISVAGLITLFIFPLFALDSGFLMSYGCAFGIGFLYSPLKKLLCKVLPDKVASPIAVSISAEIGVLPFAAAFFGTFNFLSVFANFIAVPFFSVLFTLLIIFTILTMLFSACGITLKVCEWGFVALVQIAAFFASTSLKITLIPFDMVFTALLWGIIFVASYYLLASDKLKWALCLILTTMMALCTMITGAVADTGTSASVICSSYSSYSPSLILQSKSGEVLCVNYDEDTIKYYLSMQKCNQVDYIFGLNSQNTYGGEVVLESEGYAGDFKFKVESGIYTFEVDGVKIFFTNLSNVGYNKKAQEMLSSTKYDFIYTYETGDYFCDYHVSMLTGESDYSLKASGSVKYDFASKHAWRID